MDEANTGWHLCWSKGCLISDIEGQVVPRNDAPGTSLRLLPPFSIASVHRKPKSEPRCRRLSTPVSCLVTHRWITARLSNLLNTVLDDCSAFSQQSSGHRRLLGADESSAVTQITLWSLS